MKRKMSIASFFMLVLMAASPALAADVYSLSVPSTIPNPANDFTVTYTLGGSKYGVGAASAQLSFYISASPNGSTGVALLRTLYISLRGSGYGPYYPDTSPRTETFSQYSVQANAATLLRNIAAACEPQTWYILAELDWGGYKYGQTLMGTHKQPDFSFTGGTLSPSVIQPGGTTNISFDVFTKCPAVYTSRVGIYLADSNYQLLSFIGAVSVGGGAGTSSLPPSAITFSPYMPTGNYSIVLLADMDGIISESNESNNAGAFNLTVTSGARTTLGRDVGTLQEIQRPGDAQSAMESLKLGAPDGYIESFDHREE